MVQDNYSYKTQSEQLILLRENFSIFKTEELNKIQNNFLRIKIFLRL